MLSKLHMCGYTKNPEPWMSLVKSPGQKPFDPSLQINDCVIKMEGYTITIQCETKGACPGQKSQDIPFSAMGLECTLI